MRARARLAGGRDGGGAAESIVGAAEAARAARRLVDLAPQRVVFAHGQWFARDATGELRRALAWLLEPETGGERPLGQVRPAIAPWLAGAALAGVVAAFAYARRRR